MIITFTQEEVREIMINHVKTTVFSDLIPPEDEDISVWVDVPEKDGYLVVNDGDLVGIKVWL